jgi:hypothetical protein
MWLLALAAVRAETFVLSDIEVAEWGTQSAASTALVPNQANVFVPGVTGTQEKPVDLHAKTKSKAGIFATYSALSNASTVVTNVHTVSAEVACPAGYQAAKGPLAGNLNHFATRCQKTTLCVKTKSKDALTDEDLVVSKVFLSQDGWNPNPLTAFVQKVDLLGSCGSKLHLGVEYVLPTAKESFVEPDRRAILDQYAPYFMLHSGERYFPSSVSWFFDRSTRNFNSERGWVLKTTARYSVGWGDHGNWNFPELKGERDLSRVPIYAYYLDKGNGIVDLAYYAFFPFNFGKKIPVSLNRVYGNHVGDWEHVTIRLINGVPVQAYISSHNFGETAAWDIVEKRNGRGVFYCSEGSHGFWRTPGTHVYKEVALGIVTLKDETNGSGPQWDTRVNLEGFGWTKATNTYQTVTGNRESTSWPIWMVRSDKNAANGNQNPRSGPINVWGDVEEKGCIFGQCVLSRGPSGPIDKSIWGDELR